MTNPNRFTAAAAIATAIALVKVLALASTASQAQEAPSPSPSTGWQVETPAAPSDTSTTVIPNTTVIQRNATTSSVAATSPVDGGKASLELSARLTADGQRIDRDLIWRVFQAPRTSTEMPQLITMTRDAVPRLALPAGDFLVNASFGRAHLTRLVSLSAGNIKSEEFVLNAGGLRIEAVLADRPVPANDITYQVFEAERDQSGNRRLIMDKARPGLIIRLNSGLYHIVSKYGDANASVRADVTVEAGKLTEATIAHAASTVAFKLVDQPGGEALPGTFWKIETLEGDLVKRSVGALPSHILAPGDYVVTARSSGQIYKRQFSIGNGQLAQVEVVRQ